MMQRRGIVPVGVVIATTALLFGGMTAAAASSGRASGPSTKAACAKVTDMVVGFSQPLPNPALALQYDVIKSDVTAKGGSILAAANANLDPGKQIADVDSLIQQGANVIVVAGAVAPPALQPALDRAAAAKVPVVVLDQSVGGPFATNVQSPNLSGAQMGAAYLTKLVGKSGKVAAVEGPSFAEVLVQRNKGFAAGSKSLDVVAKATGSPAGPDAARQIAETWKTQFGTDLAGVWGFNDQNALGVASSLTAEFKPKVVGLNGEPDAIAAVKSGQLAATVDVQPVPLGHTLAYSAEQAFCGKALPKSIVVEPELVTPKNAGRWLPYAAQVKKPFTVTFAQKNGETVLVTDDFEFKAKK